ncbi:phosphotransferase [Aestuariimicrobium soli]|uniref:phosphotransferase n=1 Tax=Aestuariimicrobium soli TaxID=2035834 RepID=UPI003EB7DD71
MARPDDPDGSALLTSRRVEPLLEVVVERAGGVLRSWSMDHVDSNPGFSTTATYAAQVHWPYGDREELIGVSARTSGRASSDDRAQLFTVEGREVAAWVYPADPDLPGLERAAYPEKMAALINDERLLDRPVSSGQLSLGMIGYRPRRRAVLKCAVSDPRVTFFVKVQKERTFAETLRRHRLLGEAGVPSPVVRCATADHILVLDELPGRPLAKAIFDPEPPCTAESLIGLLDSMPGEVAQLERRPPWSDAVDHYAGVITAALPDQAARLGWMCGLIHAGLDRIEVGHEPTHGDFHEGQVFVDGGRPSGMLDIDTIGPGRRGDDLACLVAHLSTVQRMNAQQAAAVHHLIRTWVPVFDERVDPVELRLRAAAVIISLATGPYRGQEPNWRGETAWILDAAEALVRQVA